MEQLKPGISIQAGEKNGHVSGAGTLSIQGDKSSIMGSFQAQNNGKTQVKLGFGDAIAVSRNGNLTFEGDGELHPDNGTWSAGTTVSYSDNSNVAAALHAQLGPDGPSGTLSVNINL